MTEPNYTRPTWKQLAVIKATEILVAAMMLGFLALSVVLYLIATIILFHFLGWR